MRTFTERPKATRQNTSATSRMSRRGQLGYGQDVSPIVNLQCVIGNHAVQRLFAVKGDSAGTDSGRVGQDAAANEVPEAKAMAAPAAGIAATRNVGGGVSEDEVVTTNGTPAPGVFPPSPPPPPAPTGQCYVTSGPAYTPSGTIPVTNAGGRKSAPFSMAATFGTAYVTLPPRKPSCCEVRQYIKWDNAFHTWRGGPPHSGFPSSATAGTWYEDRDANDKRYGHRSGTHSDPIAGCGDEYRTGSTQDQANGDTYCGRDAPGGPSSMTGQYQFQLKVIDTCNGNAEKASGSVITINW